MPLNIKKQEKVLPERPVLDLDQAVKVAEKLATEEAEIGILYQLINTPRHYVSRRIKLWEELQLAAKGKLEKFIKLYQIEVTEPDAEDFVEEVLHKAPVTASKPSGQPKSQGTSGQRNKPPVVSDKGWFEEIKDGLLGRPTE